MTDFLNIVTCGLQTFVLINYKIFYMLNYDEKLKFFGKNIAEYRKKKHYTQKVLSKMLNISREHLAKIETAKRGISIQLIFRLCDVLDVSESELFKFKQ